MPSETAYSLECGRETEKGQGEGRERMKEGGEEGGEGGRGREREEEGGRRELPALAQSIRQG